MILSGRQSKLFPLTSNLCKEDMWPKSLGIIRRLQSLRSNIINEHKLGKEAITSSQDLGFFLALDKKGKAYSIVYVVAHYIPEKIIL